MEYICSVQLSFRPEISPKTLLGSIVYTLHVKMWNSNSFPFHLFPFTVYLQSLLMKSWENNRVKNAVKHPKFTHKPPTITAVSAQ